MKHKEGKPSVHPDKRSRVVPTLLIFALLCGFSFYLGGVFCSHKNTIHGNQREATRGLRPPPRETAAPLQLKAVAFSECGSDFHDYTPCTDPRIWKKYGLHRLTFMERHCPPVFEKKDCLIPPPDGYKPPIPWPKSHNECWYRNVPYDWINKEKSNQNWLRKEGEKFIFPGGGTMFPKGVGSYVDHMVELIPDMANGAVRTAIDTGCGVASWGGDLLKRGILTMSLAPRDNHEAQVQFALERGIPAILGILSTQRLPFPSSSFDMAHCSRCLIPWTDFGGIYLIELYRILRPGAFFILSGPPVNYHNRWKGWDTTLEQQESDYNKLQTLLSSLCFHQFNQKDDISVWQKLPLNSTCYHRFLSSKPETTAPYPPLCDDGTEADSAWYTPLRPCVLLPDQKLKKLALSALPRWPSRLHVPPERVAETQGGSAGVFRHDDSLWKVRVKHYRKLLPSLGKGVVRNVMDMKTLYGGLAAALVDDPVWVMNVVSSYGANTLPVVFDRGLIGTYHDWCEAFSTYPRTYDLLHLDGLFTAEGHRCEMKNVMLEMDRILRPNGYVVIRESTHFVDTVESIGRGMRWKCRKESTEYGVENEKILLCQKQLWFSSHK